MKPVTPLCACDTFVVNDKNEVLLIQRSDNGFWALPGGCQDLGETPAQCAERECFEESGYKIEVVDLIGIYSSQKYPYINYPWKENEFSHMLFLGKVLSGVPTISSETLSVRWFKENEIPSLSDGHQIRIQHGFEWVKGSRQKSYFE